SQIAQAGGVLKSAQKFYRSEDEVKSYRRSLINGHNEGDDYVPPKPPRRNDQEMRTDSFESCQRLYLVLAR
ncbi:hypothetical protein, partial [Crocosphaera watsonii]|uniref:hypothetical protein n=1 Tax=Crocosphaera watsonii TaxID=263511 RepID=UPI001E391980